MNYNGWALLKIRTSVLILLFPAFILAGLTIIGVFAISFTVLASVSDAQLPKVQDLNTSIISPIPALGGKKQQQSTGEASVPKLHLVKILSPVKDQLVLIGKNLTISGTSHYNGATSDCEVSIIVNGIKPYQDTTPSGTHGRNDYSKWKFILTPLYTNIVEGQNKITAKFFCPNNPNLVAHNSLNVTGVSAVPTLANSLCLNSSNNNNNNNGYGVQKSANCNLNLNVNQNHPLPIISIPHIETPSTRIPIQLPFH